MTRSRQLPSRWRCGISVLITAGMLIVLRYYVLTSYSTDDMDWQRDSVQLRKAGAVVPEHNLNLTKLVWQRSEQRLQQLQSSCTALHLKQDTESLYSHLHVDTKRKLLYCYVPKVACTSWKRIFLRILGIVPRDQEMSSIPRTIVHTMVPLLSQPQFDKNRNTILKTYRKFLFVRHPFSRVLAAYKDKLGDEDKQSLYSFHSHVGQQIETMLGRPSTGGHDVSFPDFVEWLTRSSKSPAGPTFEQRNEHWLSMHNLCSPCSLNYDFMGKFETLHEDAAAVLHWMGVDGEVDGFPAADRPFHAVDFEPYYYSQLSPDQLEALAAFYSADYTAFQYPSKPVQVD